MPHRLTLHNGIPEHDKLCTCLDCRTAWEDWHESKYLDRLALQDIELRQAKPATDAEWAAFMFGDFPRAKEGVTT